MRSPLTITQVSGSVPPPEGPRLALVPAAAEASIGPRDPSSPDDSAGQSSPGVPKGDDPVGGTRRLAISQLGKAPPEERCMLSRPKRLAMRQPRQMAPTLGLFGVPGLSERVEHDRHRFFVRRQLLLRLGQFELKLFAPGGGGCSERGHPTKLASSQHPSKPSDVVKVPERPLRHEMNAVLPGRRAGRLQCSNSVV
jgi:hypothetical protein